MAIYGESITIQYVAWDTVNNAPKTGDASNHTLRWVKDGVAAAPTNAPSEVDAANAPGLYKLTLTATETQCWVGTLCGKSSTSGVVIMPLTLTFERLPTAAPGSSGGLPVIGQAPLTNLDAAVSSRSTITAADVWSYGSRTLSGFSFQVTVGGYTTGQSPSEQLQSLGYSSARAAKLDNLDAAVSSRLAASSYIAPDNASISAIKSTVDANLDVPISYLANVVIISSGTVSSDTNNSPIQFKTNLSGSANKFIGLFLKFSSTANAANEIREIIAFDQATGVVTLNKALTITPNAGDTFYLIGYSGR